MEGSPGRPQGLLPEARRDRAVTNSTTSATGFDGFDGSTFAATTHCNRSRSHTRTRSTRTTRSHGQDILRRTATVVFGHNIRKIDAVD